MVILNRKTCSRDGECAYGSKCRYSHDLESDQESQDYYSDEQEESDYSQEEYAQDENEDDVEEEETVVHLSVVSDQQSENIKDRPIPVSVMKRPLALTPNTADGTCFYINFHSYR